MGLDERFTHAVDFIRSLPPEGDFTPSVEQKLSFYSLYKQSTEGPCEEPQPNWWNQVARYKWSSWKELGNMSREEAKEKYIQTLLDIAKGFPESKEKTELYDAISPDRVRQIPEHKEEEVPKENIEPNEQIQVKEQPKIEEIQPNNKTEEPEPESEPFDLPSSLSIPQNQSTTPQNIEETYTNLIKDVFQFKADLQIDVNQIQALERQIGELQQSSIRILDSLNQINSDQTKMMSLKNDLQSLYRQAESSVVNYKDKEEKFFDIQTRVNQLDNDLQTLSDTLSRSDVGLLRSSSLIMAVPIGLGIGWASWKLWKLVSQKS